MVDVIATLFSTVSTASSAAAGAAVSGIVTHLVTRWMLARRPSEAYKTFSPSKKEKDKEELYEYLGDRIRGAQSFIYFTGGGFDSAEYCLPKGKMMIEHLHNAFKYALRKDIPVVRIQTRNNVGPEWAAMLKELLDEFPDLFNLYYVPVDRNLNIMNFCVIDPDIEQTCCVEMMCTSRQVFAKRPLRVAETAFFFLGNREFARERRRDILSMKNSPGSIHIKNSLLVDEVLGARPEEPLRLNVVS